LGADRAVHVRLAAAKRSPNLERRKSSVGPDDDPEPAQGSFDHAHRSLAQRPPGRKHDGPARKRGDGRKQAEAKTGFAAIDVRHPGIETAPDSDVRPGIFDLGAQGPDRPEGCLGVVTKARTAKDGCPLGQERGGRGPLHVAFRGRSVHGPFKARGTDRFRFGCHRRSPGHV